MQTWFVAVLLHAWEFVSGQIHYSIPEELEKGAFVGNIAKDVGLEVSELSRRRFRIMTATKKRYFEVNSDDGVLFVNDKIDREQLCSQSLTCSQNVEVVIENPLNLYRAEVEIQDINDNSPTFPQSEMRLEIVESTPPGIRLPLQSAQDLDVGRNSIRAYVLSPNDHFKLDVQNISDGTKTVYLLLNNYLDREKQVTHNLVLTALDGGVPERSGTVRIIVTVLDVNDNVPVFDKPVYRVKVIENEIINTLVIKLNATDLDEGTNADIIYSFSSSTPQRIRELFSVEQHTGEIRVKGMLDYEESNAYEVSIVARDKSPTFLPVYCKVIVEIQDVNDIQPEIALMSVLESLPENATTGTMIAVLSVTDPESGENGNTRCLIPKQLPFELKSAFKNTYLIVTSGLLDRETVPQYKIKVTCFDAGSPQLSVNKVITLEISDINDNAPSFLTSSYTAYVMENNTPGASICSVTAFDSDRGRNSDVSYSIMESQTQGLPTTSIVSINSANGVIFSQRSFDYEQFKNFQIQVQASDAGIPSLSSSVMVNVVILDQNDNSPVIASTRTENETRLSVPRSAYPGYLVTKVVATDADSGQNARLSYYLIHATDMSLFIIHSGELKTKRFIDNRDSTTQVCVVLVKDNGHPSLSSTATITVLLVDSNAEITSEFHNLSENIEDSSNLAVYIIISLGLTSFILLLIIIFLVTSICLNSDETDHDCSLNNHCLGREIPNHAPKAKARFQIDTDVQSNPAPKVMKVSGNGSLSGTHCYQFRPATEQERNACFFHSPSTSMARKSDIKNAEIFSSDYNQRTKRSPRTSKEVSEIHKNSSQRYTH
ncbi:protocadherin alpha-C2-like [Mobula birostris]|uniref:protocadherin alpha-C2-like n=1 Tax=Mobula birostris TaxID=1983395 RepID=UPI003B2831D2